MERESSFLDYELPEHLIAQTPVEPRDASRLLLVERASQSLEDCRFRDLPELLEPGDLLVVNDSRVIPARILARRASGGQVELLLLEDLGGGSWEALARPLGRLRQGEELQVLDAQGEPAGAGIRLVQRRSGLAIVQIDERSVIDRFGRSPLPPYIGTEPADRERYQTVYASAEGSAAAPTAGLHFTPELLERCRQRGIEIETVTLHVGIDTFRPLTDEDPEKHVMHSERFSIAERAWNAIQCARAEGRRVVSVGTTTTRVLETVGSPGWPVSTLTGRTSIFIRPPFKFQVVDAQITNFHLPRTTLLLMISAFAGRRLLRRVYEHAIGEGYRFYSFGDAMLIV